MNMDPNYVNQFRQVTNNIWQQLYQRYYPQMTNAEASMVQSRYCNESGNLVNQLINMQMQRNGAQLSEQEVYVFLETYLKMVLQQTRQNQMGMYGNNIPVGNTGFGMPSFNAGMTGFGMNRPMGFNNPMGGMGMNMGGMGMSPAFNMYGNQTPQMGMVPQAPVTGNMPSAQTMSMASMYDLKPSQPAVPQPTVPTQNIQQPVIQKSMAPVSTAPTTKITADIQPYQDPILSKTSNLKKGNKYGAKGTVTEYVDENNKKLIVANLTLNRWVDFAHSAIAKLVDQIKPNFMRLNYKKYQLVNIPFDDLKKTMFDIKDVIQKAKASETSYDSFEYLAMSMDVLNNKTRGISKFVENLVIDRFNHMAYAKNLGNGAFIVDSTDKILSFKDTVKDNNIMTAIDEIIFNIVDTVLSDTCVYDCASKEVEDYIKNDVVRDGKTYAELKEDTEAFNKFCKDYCMIVSCTCTTVWTDLTFKDTVMPISDDSFSTLSQAITLDDSPVDTDIEYFVKTIVKDAPISNLIINADNITLNYVVNSTASYVYMRKAGLF